MAARAAKEEGIFMTFCYDTGERYLSVEGLFPLPA
jgi:hypothetical protein